MKKQTVRKASKKTPFRRLPKKRPNPLAHALKFLPAVLFFAAAAALHHQPVSYRASASRQSVLSYATSVSGADLLAQTNAQRTGNGVASLSLNGQLNSAAQTKANDMVTRNYWSHTTPDGVEPWTFITNAGYQYQTAGENLAYGFATSADTVTGWMNSPPHRQNLLNGSFTEVGFGFANSPNYVNDGQQTVVVAMYAAPLAPAAPVSNNTANVQPQQTRGASTPAAAPAPSTQAIESTAAPAPAAEPTSLEQNDTAQTKTAPMPQPKVATASTANVRRIQVLTGGSARWSSTLLAATICGVGVLWALERGRQIKKLVLAGEHFVLKHAHIDLAVIGFVVLGLTLLQTSGLVR